MTRAKNLIESLETISESDYSTNSKNYKSAVEKIHSAVSKQHSDVSKEHVESYLRSRTSPSRQHHSEHKFHDKIRQVIRQHSDHGDYDLDHDSAEKMGLNHDERKAVV